MHAADVSEVNARFLRYFPLRQTTRFHVGIPYTDGETLFDSRCVCVCVCFNQLECNIFFFFSITSEKFGRNTFVRYSLRAANYSGVQFVLDPYSDFENEKKKILTSLERLERDIIIIVIIRPIGPTLKSRVVPCR